MIVDINKKEEKPVKSDNKIDKIMSDIDIYDKMIKKLEKEGAEISGYITENMMGVDGINFKIDEWRDKLMIVNETWKHCEVAKKELITKLEVLGYNKL